MLESGFQIRFRFQNFKILFFFFFRGCVLGEGGSGPARLFPVCYFWLIVWARGYIQAVKNSSPVRRSFMCTGILRVNFSGPLSSFRLCRPEHIQAVKNQFVTVSATQKSGAGQSSGGGVIPAYGNFDIIFDHF